MTVFVCVDDGFGLTFNNRRQSRDSAVIEKIKEMIDSEPLYITPFSQKLFSDDDVIITDDIFSLGDKDSCFLEDIDPSEIENMISTLVLFKWNRKYPSDKKMTLEFDHFSLEESFEFEGNSHERITCEVWVK